jgi:hypothetical protein
MCATDNCQFADPEDPTPNADATVDNGNTPTEQIKIRISEIETETRCQKCRQLGALKLLLRITVCNNIVALFVTKKRRGVDPSQQVRRDGICDRELQLAVAPLTRLPVITFEAKTPEQSESELTEVIHLIQPLTEFLAS